MNPPVAKPGSQGTASLEYRFLLAALSSDVADGGQNNPRLRLTGEGVTVILTSGEEHVLRYRHRMFARLYGCKRCDELGRIRGKRTCKGTAVQTGDPHHFLGSISWKLNDRFPELTSFCSDCVGEECILSTVIIRDHDLRMHKRLGVS